MVTSKHIHFSREARDFASSTRVDDGDRDIIPRSLQLVAGRTGQEYNQRKGRPDKSGSSAKEHSGWIDITQRQWKDESIFFVVSYISIFTPLNSLRLVCTTPRFCKATKMVGSTPALLKISN